MALARFITAEGQEFWSDDFGGRQRIVFPALRELPTMGWTLAEEEIGTCCETRTFYRQKFAASLVDYAGRYLGTERWYEYHEGTPDKEHWSRPWKIAARQARRPEDVV